MQEEKSKILFFDYDGVMVDSLECVAKIHGRILRQFGKNIAVSASLIKENWSGGWQGLYEHTYGLTREEIPLTVPVYRELALAEFVSVRLCKGIEPVIKKLAKRHQLVVVSANYSDIIYRTLTDTGLDAYFSGIFGQGELAGIEKSDPRFFLNPIEELNVEKEEVVAIGDTVGEIYGAKKAGIPVIACSWGWQIRDLLVEAKPDYLADTPKELLQIIQEI